MFKNGLLPKIGFTGAGGTGKTTTVVLVKNMLGSKDQFLPLLPSPARAIFKKWNLTSESDQENMSIEDKIKLQNEIYEARYEEEKNTPSFISDRTLLDNFAYHLFRCYQGIDDEDVQSLITRTVANLKTYDYIFYFPLLARVEVDGFRYSNGAYQTMIDSIIYSFLEKNKILYITMGNGTPMERAQMIFDHITHDDPDQMGLFSGVDHANL